MEIFLGILIAGSILYSLLRPPLNTSKSNSTDAMVKKKAKSNA